MKDENGQVSTEGTNSFNEGIGKELSRETISGNQIKQMQLVFDEFLQPVMVVSLPSMNCVVPYGLALRHETRHEVT